MSIRGIETRDFDAEIRDLSLEELRKFVREKEEYTSGLLARFNSIDTQFRRMSREKAVLDLNVERLERRNKHLEEQHELDTALMKIVVAAKKDSLEQAAVLAKAMVGAFFSDAPPQKLSSAEGWLGAVLEKPKPRDFGALAKAARAKKKR